MQKQHGETIHKLDETIKWLENENANTMQREKEAQHKLRERAKQIKELEQEKREKEDKIKSMMGEYKDLKERFGKVAGAKMKHDNPDIINLGDKHRSTKTADEYNAIYNDSWTDAAALLTENAMLSDEKATETLLDMLKDCHAFCQEKADDQFESLKSFLFNPIQSVTECFKEITIDDGPKSTGEGGSSPTITTLREVRKEISIEAVEQVKAVYLKHIEKDTGYGTKLVTLTRPYLEKCVEVCWAMVLNVPPLYMDFEVKAGTKVDINLYTRRSSGETIKALVWPPLFNGKGGGLLNKGVVEAVKTVKKCTKF